MKILKVSASRFMAYRRMELEFPDNGLVVVTGDNGSGKSSIVEAVAWAAWGKTLRGTDPASGSGCIATLGADGIGIARVKNPPKLRVCVDGGMSSYTPTKGTAVVESYLGGLDVWSRTHVFSSDLGKVRFTGATDAGRKRFLESLLGVDRFDLGLERCRADLSAAVRKRSRLQLRLAELAVSNKEKLAFVEGFGGEDVAGLRRELDESLELREQVSLDEADLRSRLGKVRREEAKWSVRATEDAARLGALNEKLRLLNEDRCPRCGQEMNSGFVAAAVPEVERGVINVEAALCGARGEVGRLRRLVGALEGELAELAVSSLDLERYVVRLRSRLEAASRRDAILGEMSQLEGEVGGLREDLSALECELAELGVSEEVLGLRGARASLVGSVLGALEEAANSWLARLPAGGGSSLSISLSQRTHGSRGSVREEIYLGVNGRPYRAASRGQRSRVDAALLCAQSDVAAGATGRGKGTLFYDEVFDSLDSVGKGAALEVMEEQARDRAVVLITHDDYRFGVGSLRVEAGDGTLRVRR